MSKEIRIVEVPFIPPIVISKGPIDSEEITKGYVLMDESRQYSGLDGVPHLGSKFDIRTPFLSLDEAKAVRERTLAPYRVEPMGYREDLPKSDDLPVVSRTKYEPK